MIILPHVPQFLSLWPYPVALPLIFQTGSREQRSAIGIGINRIGDDSVHCKFNSWTCHNIVFKVYWQVPRILLQFMSVWNGTDHPHKASQLASPAFRLNCSLPFNSPANRRTDRVQQHVSESGSMQTLWKGTLFRATLLLNQSQLLLR